MRVHNCTNDRLFSLQCLQTGSKINKLLDLGSIIADDSALLVPMLEDNQSVTDCFICAARGLTKTEVLVRAWLTKLLQLKTCL